MSRFVVLGGAGAIGRIIVRDLFESNPNNRIAIADFNQDAARAAAERRRSRRVTWCRADARTPDNLREVLSGASVVINCTRHKLNLNVMEAALQARVHYVDLGGLFTWTRRQLRLRRGFADRGVTAVLGMGCAPGLSNVMAAAAAAAFERVDSVRIRVGGIDLNAARNTAELAFPYSAETIIEELTLPPWKWSRGQFVKTPPRSGWERIDFGPPVGAVWVVMTRHSEIATLPAYFRSRGLRYLDFKVAFDRGFVRELMRRLRQGWTVRDFQALPAPRDAPNDYEVARVIVRGRLPGKRRASTITMECHARSKPAWRASSGDIDTACPASIVAQMLACRAIDRPGVWAPEDVVPAEPLFEQLRRRGMAISRSPW